MAARYAIYAAPRPGSPLALAAGAWLGADDAARRRAFPDLSDDAWAAMTEAPRRYGFHATLKPPFRLAPGLDAGMLEDALARFAAVRPPVALPRLAVATLGGFIALRPAEDCPEADALAADCVRHFDSFRAPIDQAERGRRAVGLDATEAAYLDRWGFPYVIDRFRFHMTLTGRLSASDRALWAPALRSLFDDAACAPWTIDDACLFVQADPDGPFRLELRAPFGAR